MSGSTAGRVWVSGYVGNRLPMQELTERPLW